jgi:hypothetical protein
MDKYKGEDAVVLNILNTVNIEVKRKGLIITEGHLRDELLLAERSHLFGENAIYYTSYFQNITSIEACTYLEEEGKYKKYKVENFFDERPGQNGIFYDDLMSKRFIYPALHKGAITHLQYTEQYTDPHVQMVFRFKEYLPVENAEFTVSFPEEVKLRYIQYGDFSGIEFSSLKKRGRTTYTWKKREIPKFPDDESAPGIRYYAPQVILIFEEYNHKGKKVEVFSDTRRLLKWYSSLVAGMNKTQNPLTDHFVDSLASGKEGLEKIKAIYYWVQDNIKYIAFEDGMGGFIPREASLVFSRRFGDCKDKTSLLTYMLQKAGIPAFYVWTGTRDIPYKHDEIPTGLCDNHMVTAIRRDGKWVILDPTASNVPYGLVPSVLQGKEAFIMVSPDSFDIYQIPEIAPELNCRIDSTLVHIDENNMVKAEGFCKYTGLWKAKEESDLKICSPKELEDELKNLFRKGSNKCKLDSVWHSDYYNKDIPLDFYYRVSIPDYAKAVGNELYINPHLIKGYQRMLVDEKERKLDYELNMKFLDEQISVINIPVKYKLKSLPDNKNYISDDLSFSVTYTSNDSIVVMKKRVRVNTLFIPLEKIKTWNDMINEIISGFKDVITFEKSEP